MSIEAVIAVIARDGLVFTLDGPTPGVGYIAKVNGYTATNMNAENALMKAYKGARPDPAAGTPMMRQDFRVGR